MQNSNYYHPLRQLTPTPRSRFGAGDVLVLFGELFHRGYGNGLVEEAERRGMKVIRATVGRRDKDGTLRPLTPEEVASSPGPLINIPLEAGFDMEPASDGLSPVERLKDAKLSDWQNIELSQKMLFESREKGRARFTAATKQFVQELSSHLPPDKNVLFAHLMAGGVPRAKIIMPLMNRSVKGTGDRFLSSEVFWKSALGRLCEMNFYEVTAKTFDVLIKETTDLRNELTSKGQFCAYSAYGYHGTEVLLNGQYQWQTYTPYLQGWAKKALEDYSREWAEKGVRCCVYNCPEILTNSSSIFQGVEIPLYPLLWALKKEGPDHPLTKSAWFSCSQLLKDATPEGLEHLLLLCQKILTDPCIVDHCHFEKWPQHNSERQLSRILQASDSLIDLHTQPKELVTFPLSEIVFNSCGKVMIHDAALPQNPVAWINHDIVAKTTLAN